MSKAKNKREKRRGKPQPKPVPDNSRRRFLVLGLGGLGTLAAGGIAAGYKAGWFGSNPVVSSPPPSPTPNLATGKPLPPIFLPPDYQNALRAADDIVRHYARELNNPSALIHAVRAFGKNFTLHDGTKAVDYLCSRFAAEKEVGGKRYVYFPREAEVHDNSFLKTLLEASVSLEQQISVGSNRYTLRDLGDSAKALFRCDPQNLSKYDPALLHTHMPWGLIAFSILVPPSQSVWVNAYGETINLPQVIDRSLAAYEGSCSGVSETLSRGEMESLEFRQEMAKYSCAGMHMFYGLFSCLKHGYRDNNLPSRLSAMFDSLLYRLEGDPKAIDREADAAKGLGPDWVNKVVIGQEGKQRPTGAPPPETLEVLRLRYQIRALGHAHEAINFARLHKLFSLTLDQKKRLQIGEQLLYQYLVKLRATDLEPYMRWYSKFVSDIVIAAGHASRGMKLLTPDNPDTIAAARSIGSQS